MHREKQQFLESKGWKIGDAAELLNLTPDEREYIELKLALARAVRDRREKKNLTQVEMAKLLKSSQSRVAKIEMGDPSVSLDLMIRSLIALGATKRELARAISAASR